MYEHEAERSHLQPQMQGEERRKREKLGKAINSQSLPPETYFLQQVAPSITSPKSTTYGSPSAYGRPCSMKPLGFCDQYSSSHGCSGTFVVC